MFERFFKSQHPTTLETFLNSTNSKPWDYLGTLQIKSNEVHYATQQQILDNPGDVAIGVNQVEVILDHLFFDLFRSLVVKHHDDGEVRLMFNETVTDANKVAEFYGQIKSKLGTGIHHQPKFSSFEDFGKIRSLSQGRYDNLNDEILHYWGNDGFSFTLNYKLEPLGQLVFIVTNRAEKEPDTKTRNNGTLINLLQHNINEVFERTEDFATVITEDGLVKFTDYGFKVDPPELRLFDVIKIRTMGEKRSLGSVKSLLVTYQTTRSWDIADAIQLVDSLVKIYGQDGSGYAELRPHEIDMLEDREFWTGRSWFINQQHGLHDFEDSEQVTLYWVNLTHTEEGGLNLSVLGFEKMEDYHTGRI
ncbi:hypothetical protein [Mucilaginibacter kameinonensis]|uniref:hypothetical protein n=1 Tax=Mucilaginibacter kameinonensis TaxID=452286 RepID=UPI000EF7765D|nr:hypothetical protein [Mucilaginibacter kameinonensis]